MRYVYLVMSKLTHRNQKCKSWFI